MNGDLVVVRVEKDSRRVRNRDVSTGEVTRVLRRAHRTVVGRFHEKENGGLVAPFDVRLDHNILIDEGATLDAIEGEMVDVEIDRYPDRSSNFARGRVLERLGFIGDPGVDIEVVIRKLHIPHDFPPQVLAAASSVPMSHPLPSDIRFHCTNTPDCLEVSRPDRHTRLSSAARLDRSDLIA